MTGLTLVVARAPETTSEPDISHVHALLAHLTEGASFRPRPGPADATAILCELAGAAAELASGRRSRAVVRLGNVPDPWEMGLERAGRDVLVSVFQGGPVPDVALHERRLDGDAFAGRVLAALRALAGRNAPGRALLGPSASANDAPPPADDDAHEIAAASSRRSDLYASPLFSPMPLGSFEDDDVALAGDAPRLTAAIEALSAALPFGSDAASAEPSVVPVDPTGDVSIVIAADVVYRAPAGASGPAPAVLRADLFSLLFRGRLRITVGEHARELPDVFVFLLAEQLATIALEALEAWTRGRPYYRRLTAFGAICGVKLAGEGAASLTIGLPRRRQEARAQTWTFPAVDVGALAQGVVAFGRALTRSLVRRDRAQSSNLRLQAFRARIRELGARLRDATFDDSKINAAPEGYRAFAASVRPAPPPSSGSFGRARLRFSSRWSAAVASIDLRSTFLCGDRLVVGATRQISCIEARTGAPLWERPVPRAVAVMTPLGLGRLQPDGALDLHDLGNGEIVWSARLSPRVGASASGTVVSAPGLPRMLILSEGARHLAAVDLHGGEVRWRFAARRGGVFRLRRAGKLVIVASGDPALTALDVLTGEVVWRFCDRLRFASHVAVDRDALFALAGAGAFVGRGGTRLHHMDPWSGEVRWSVDVPAHVAPVGAPLLGPETVVVATEGRGGMGLVGFDRQTGALRFDHAVCSSAASCLMVDGTVVVNSEGGELVGVSAADGATRYRHVFASGAEGDRPRRLEPVLRSGALFVPQSEVHVVRPHDGTLLGVVPNDIVPDLLRVDERCDVYIAEESGHLAAYSAAARLSLVTPV